MAGIFMKFRPNTFTVAIFFSASIDWVLFIIFTIYYNINKKRCQSNFPINNVHTFAFRTSNFKIRIVLSEIEENLQHQITLHAFFNFPSIESIHLTMDLCCQTTDSHWTDLPYRNKAIAFIFAPFSLISLVQLVRRQFQWAMRQTANRNHLHRYSRHIFYSVKA